MVFVLNFGYSQVNKIIMLRRGFFKKSVWLSIGALLGANRLSHERVFKLKNTFNELDWDALRSQFEICQRKAYFNSATIGPSPEIVMQSVFNKMRAINEKGSYRGSEKAREALANFFSVKVEEICLTHNATESINIIAQGLALKKGDEVIISDQEHVGHALPWLNRAEQIGIKLKVFKTAKTSKDNLNRILSLITKRTKVISIPHVNCTTGTRMPIELIGKELIDKEIFFLVDGAQAVGNIELNLDALPCDFYAASCHKWLLGPKGTGFLYIKKSMLDTIKPVFVGASSDVSWVLNQDAQKISAWNSSADRYDYGTQNAALYVGLAKALEFLTDVGMEKIQTRCMYLSSHLLKSLQKELLNNVEIITPLEDISRTSIVSFKPKNIDYKELTSLINKSGFRVRQVAESDLNAIRVSTHFFNTIEEIDRLVFFLKKTLSF